MVKAALFIGWGALIPGREKQAPEVLNAAVRYCAGLQQNGTIDGFEAFALEPHGGEREGFVLIRGDRESIARLRVDDEFVKTIVGVQLVHTKVGVVGARTGAEMESLFQMWDEREKELRIG